MEQLPKNLDRKGQGLEKPPISGVALRDLVPVPEDERRTALTASMLYVLLHLAAGEIIAYSPVGSPGYALRVAKNPERAEETAGEVRLFPANSYWSITRLLRGGLIEEYPEEYGEPPEDPVLKEKRPDFEDRRRYYRLTDLGQQVAAKEAQRLKGILEKVSNVST
jgi:hypothetical protein